ncbi:MAG: protein translocase subunit SecF [Candidatus Paceibacterota bacterium]|jgi:preprotein translocase subunit SecF
MFVVKYRKIFYGVSIAIIAASVYSIATYGLKLGIDFTGGSNLEVVFAEAPDTEAIKGRVDALNIGSYTLRPAGDTGVIVRSRDLTEPERASLVAAVSGSDASATVKTFDSVGPILGEELKGKALWSIFFVLLAIILFITFAFRHVSKPVASWKYGMVAIVALLHDVIVPAGVFAYLGHFYGTEIDALFVTALLVVLGFSIHDTIVVFDRTRENLQKEGGKKPFEQIVGESVSQTFTRSINTSVTTLLAIAALFVFGSEATHDFSLALFVGIAVGTYSSIFIGSPLLVTLEKWQKKA